MMGDVYVYERERESVCVGGAGAGMKKEQVVGNLVFRAQNRYLSS